MKRLLLALVLCMPVAAADELVVITRQGCPPCAKLKADLLRKPEMYRGHELRLLEGREAMAEWDVDLVPTVVRLRHGREVGRRVGYSRPSDLTDWLKKHD